MGTTSQSRAARDEVELSAVAPVVSDSTDGTTNSLEQAEAEATAAEARATAARARLDELRKSRTARSAGGSEQSTDDTETDDPAQPSSRRRQRQWRRPQSSTIFTTAAVFVACVLLAASGYLHWQHQQAEREHQRRTEFAAAAGQAVVTLMTINSSTAQDDVQRIIDNSTGQFRDDFQQSAKEFVEVAHESQAVTKATVKASAVESMTHDSAVVLVTAATTITNTAGANEQPRTWRLSVDVTQESGQIKMSKVDFVP
jgi:Mce-associated membrane protein